MTIAYKNRTNLIASFEQQEEVEVLKPQSLLNKVAFRKKEYADIYFHSGVLDKEAEEAIENAKVVIVTSKSSCHEVLDNTNQSKKNIHVIYPPVSDTYLKPKESKKILAEALEFDEKKKILFFTAKNFKSNGAKEFCDLLQSINYKHIQVIIAGDKTQINNLRFQTSKYHFGDKVIMLEDYPEMDRLFSAADIFILPTRINGFASNILKAMFFKTAVFVTDNSTSSEVVDVFATMNSPTDRSLPFKVDALLGRKADLDEIKKTNRKVAKQYTLEKQMEKLQLIVENLNKA